MKVLALSPTFNVAVNSIHAVRLSDMIDNCVVVEYGHGEQWVHEWDTLGGADAVYKRILREWEAA